MLVARLFWLVQAIRRRCCGCQDVDRRSFVQVTLNVVFPLYVFLVRAPSEADEHHIEVWKLGGRLKAWKSGSWKSGSLAAESPEV